MLIESEFTSHYVSINSLYYRLNQNYHLYLHPTMYLLIRFKFQPTTDCVL